MFHPTAPVSRKTFGFSIKDSQEQSLLHGSCWDSHPMMMTMMNFPLFYSPTPSLCCAFIGEIYKLNPWSEEETEKARKELLSEGTNKWVSDLQDFRWKVFLPVAEVGLRWALRSLPTQTTVIPQWETRNMEETARLWRWGKSLEDPREFLKG